MVRGICLALGLASALCVSLEVGVAAEWRVEPINMDARIEAIRIGRDGQIVLETRRRAIAVDLGSEDECALSFRWADRRRQEAGPPGDALPDGGVATVDDGMIRQAWYAAPTRRYGHGVLGDRIEAGALVVVDAADRLHRVDLNADLVFEDLTPRLADLDGDGSAEVVTIQSSLTEGAAVAVYAMRAGSVELIARTPFIGIPNRWLNPSIVTDLTGDGRAEITLVRTPHIGGRLEIWSLRDGMLIRRAALEGFSNHAIGSRQLGLSATADVSGDGVREIIMPGATRRSLRFITAKEHVREIGRMALPAAVSTNIVIMNHPSGGPVLLYGDSRGMLNAVHQGSDKIGHVNNVCPIRHGGG